MSQKAMDPMQKSIRFLNSMLVVFFVREKPASTSAKPVCMKKTSTAANNTQKVLSAYVVVIVSIVVRFYYSLMYNDSGPVSPVLSLIDYSTGEIKILPSPSTPVLAALMIAWQEEST